MIGVEWGHRIWSTNEKVHSFIYLLYLSKNILIKSLKNTKMKTNQAHQLRHDTRGVGSADWELTIKGEIGRLPEENGI